MTWWQIAIIIALIGIVLDNMVTNICRAIVTKKKDGENDA